MVARREGRERERERESGISIDEDEARSKPGAERLTSDQSLEGQLPDEEFGRLLVLSDLTCGSRKKDEISKRVDVER